MKRIILIVALVAIMLGQNTSAQDTTNQSLQVVITDYLTLKNELTKDNHKTVSIAANSLSADIKSVPMGIFSADLNKIWLQYYDVLINNTSIIGSTTDIGEQREKFKDLSANFYKLLKEMEINTVELYYQYCTMADAYWISENSKISNPYYGKKMISCGSTKETLKANKP